VIGTLGNGLWGQLGEKNLTTPDAIEVARCLADFLQKGATHVVLEASSHGLAQQRLRAVQVDIAIFTNLSHDHLDYHGDITHYAEAKFSLFEYPSVAYAVLNLDDAWGQKWRQALADKLSVYGYGEQTHPVTRETAGVYAHKVKTHLHGLEANITTPWGQGLVHAPLLGRFNLHNLLAVITTLGLLEWPLSKILQALKQLTSVPGRMQLCGGGGRPHIIIDYAHTPDALAKTLAALREHLQGQLWCVFGCGGDRDKAKRAEMGRIAEAGADHLVLTDDNPRSENPQTIVADIKAGMQQPHQAVIEHQRSRAIRHAIQCAQSNDMVLIAGKGHETQQVYATQTQPFSDLLEVQKTLEE
jgi:UDP-N-acetylmuramoyl-L-alanyl-D-glutamate--2,6-diaminopimelate ligase